MTNKELIVQIGAAAVKQYPAYKILPSMTIAQAILESNWGKSGLAKDCHNYFGMKWITCRSYFHRSLSLISLKVCILGSRWRLWS